MYAVVSVCILNLNISTTKNVFLFSRLMKRRTAIRAKQKIKKIVAIAIHAGDDDCVSITGAIGKKKTKRKTFKVFISWSLWHTLTTKEKTVKKT